MKHDKNNNYLNGRMDIAESRVEWTIHVRRVRYELNLRMINAIWLPLCACGGVGHVHSTGRYLDSTDTWRELCGCTEASVLNDNHNVCADWSIFEEELEPI